MGRSKARKRKEKTLGTIRRIPDDLWMMVQPLLPHEKRPGTNGRPVVPFRVVLDGGTLRAADRLPMESVAC